jgi:hypothetical protein
VLLALQTGQIHYRIAGHADGDVGDPNISEIGRMFPKEAECFPKKPNVSERTRMYPKEAECFRKKPNVSEKIRIFPKEAETVDNQCQHMGIIF